MKSQLTFSLLYCIKEVDSVLFGVFWVIDHRKGQNVIRTSMTHSPNGSCASFLFLPHFDVICQLFIIEQICLIINLTKSIDCHTNTNILFCWHNLKKEIHLDPLESNDMIFVEWSETETFKLKCWSIKLLIHVFFSDINLTSLRSHSKMC